MINIYASDGCELTIKEITYLYYINLKICLPLTYMLMRNSINNGKLI